MSSVSWRIVVLLNQIFHLVKSLIQWVVRGQFTTVEKVTAATSHRLTCNSQFRWISSLAKTQIKAYSCPPLLCVNRNVFMGFSPKQIRVSCQEVVKYSLLCFKKKTPNTTQQPNTTIATLYRSSSKQKAPITVNSHKEAGLTKILLPTFSRAHRSPLSESKELTGWVTCSKKICMSSWDWHPRAGEWNQLKRRTLGQSRVKQFTGQGHGSRAQTASTLHSHFLHPQMGSIPLTSVTS